MMRVYGRVIGLLKAERNLAIALAIANVAVAGLDRKSTRLNSSHSQQSRMPSSA